MSLPSYHNHTCFCDGKNTAEEMVLAAIQAGMPEIGFSGHARMPLEPDWCMTEEGEKEYFESISALKIKYADKIKIYLGIEQDYYSVPVSYPYDYIIGSVHALDVGDGKLIDIDLDLEDVRRNVEEYFDGDPYKYVEAYYDTVSKAYEKTKCDIIGHFDLVTKFLDIDPLFSEEHPRYVAARDKALKALLENTHSIFEVNTGGIYRGYRKVPYPNTALVSELYKKGARFVINADSHRTESIDFMLSPIASELENNGVPYFTSLDEILEITRKHSN